MDDDAWRLIGLGAVEGRVYEALCRAPATSAAGLADDLGLDRACVRDVLDVLTERGLVRRSPTHHERVLAISPRVALRPAVSRIDQALGEQQRQVRALDARLLDLAAEQEDQLMASSATHDLSLSRESAQSLLEATLGSTARKVRMSMPFRPSPEMIAASQALDATLLAREVRVHALYVDSVRMDPATMSYLTWLSQEGAHVRLLPLVPVRMLISDTACAMVAHDPLDPELGTSVVRSTGVVAGLIHLFDVLWAQGVPFADHAVRNEVELSPLEVQIIELMGRGFKDEATAKVLGVSVRTARRVISRLCDRAHVQSRFELGAEAVRRGWLP